MGVIGDQLGILGGRGEKMVIMEVDKMDIMGGGGVIRWVLWGRG